MEEVAQKAPILWLPDTKSRLIRKKPDAGKDGRQEKKVTREDRMVDGMTDSMEISFSKLWEMVKDKEAWCTAVHDVSKSRTQLSD